MIGTITVMSFKGGAGKTTIAVSLAATAFQAGLKTLLVDTDPLRASTLSLSARTMPGPDHLVLSPGALFQNGSTASRAGYDIRIVDTPAAPKADVAAAANCADLCLVVCRPTFLDIAAVLASAEMIRQLGRRGAVVLNQCQASRGNHEPPSIRRAREALALTGLPLAGVIGSRVAYQQSVARGLAAGEIGSVAAATEIRSLWDYASSLLKDAGTQTNPAHLKLVSA
ncbi:ParA family protein [Brevundimonas sp.]|uniref:ParA family protein n=1 Tax=Brevundimonas sp. TaxID=1871086 RepID=UPI002D343709|nr:ParA family protein [Brevundimonas sp.]HYC75882.1 ParA family protein [Brevundimonas sp.]